MIFIAFTLHMTLKAQPTGSIEPPIVISKNIFRTIEKTIHGERWEMTLKNESVIAVKRNEKPINIENFTTFAAEIEDLKASAHQMSNGTMSEANAKPKDVLLSNAKKFTQEQTSANIRIEEVLLQEGLIGLKSPYKLILTEKSMVLNDEIMPKPIAEKYINLYYVYSGEERCDSCKFKFTTIR